MISFAKDNEDVVMARALADIGAGVYLDLDPGAGAATRSLHGSGWRGALVSVRALASARSGDLALAPEDLSPKPLEELRRLGLWPVTLLRLGPATPIDLGAELLASSPLVVVADDTVVRAIGKELEEWDYVAGGFDGVNHYFAHREDVDRLALLYPACSRDDFVDDEFAELLAEHRELAGRLDALTRSGTRRRYESRLQPVVAPVIDLDRVVVMDPSGLGGFALAELLAGALGTALVNPEHPTDLDPETLPERLVVCLNEEFQEHLRVVLLSHGLRVVTPIRHPFSLLAIWRSPTEAGWCDWAVSEPVATRVGANARWAVEPGTIAVNFDDFATDPYKHLVGMLDELGLIGEGTPVFAREAPALIASVASSLPAGPDWRALIPADALPRLADRYRRTFEQLAIALPVLPEGDGYGESTE